MSSVYGVPEISKKVWKCRKDLNKVFLNMGVIFTMEGVGEESEKN